MNKCRTGLLQICWELQNKGHYQRFSGIFPLLTSICCNSERKALQENHKLQNWLRKILLKWDLGDSLLLQKPKHSHLWLSVFQTCVSLKLNWWRGWLYQSVERKKKKRFFLYKERKNGLRSMKEKELREQIGKQTKCYLHRWGKQELTRGEKSIFGDKINIFTPHMSYRFSSCVYKSRVCHSFL